LISIKKRLFIFYLISIKGTKKWYSKISLDLFIGDIRMHANRKLDTVRGIGKILRFERRDREGGGGGGGGGSGTREGKHHEDC